MSPLGGGDAVQPIIPINSAYLGSKLTCLGKRKIEEPCVPERVTLSFRDNGCPVLRKVAT
jgi:hypothetical protein